MIKIINIAKYYIWKLSREKILRVLFTKENFFSPISLILYPYEVLDIH